ncbi:hypothetical protein WMY93_001761 [Mugilogobius chulae]|uniref:Uncharacterized protein n=1 Tax=Mugilogobius chulae TaxID=88201 RepID=A0AAW0Q068_9GOBI
MQVLSVVPTDAKALAKLGELYDCEGDKSQAYHYYCESYRYFPSNIDVIVWLAAYHIETHFFEKAIQYFERATLIQPTEVKWQLMVASGFRKSGNYQKSLETYKKSTSAFQKMWNVGLRLLVKLCTNMGLADVQEYAGKLKKLEKMRDLREQRVKSGHEGSAKSRREGSAGSSDSGHSSSGGSRGERLSSRLRSLPASNEPYESSSPKELDASPTYPLGRGGETQTETSPGGVSGAGVTRKKPPVRRGCLPLPEEILEQMYGRLSVGIMSAFHHALQLEQNPADQHNVSCPSAAWASAAPGPAPVNLLSISPWAYRMSHDPSRYPRSIPEAYCLCRGCLIGPYGQESADFHSVPVFSPAVVLRRRSGPCVAGRYSYSEDYISVAVGCTCVPAMEQGTNEAGV